MISSVELDGQTLIAIEEVWATQPPSVVVAQWNLNLRLGKPTKNEEHPQSSFHRGLSLRFGQRNCATQARNAFCSGVQSDIRAKLLDRNQLCTKKQIYSHYSFSYRVSTSQIDNSPERRRGR